jgi:hypothetical protein
LKREPKQSFLLKEIEEEDRTPTGSDKSYV